MVRSCLSDSVNCIKKGVLDLDLTWSGTKSELVGWILKPWLYVNQVIRTNASIFLNLSCIVIKKVVIKKYKIVNLQFYLLRNLAYAE